MQTKDMLTKILILWARSRLSSVAKRRKKSPWWNRRKNPRKREAGHGKLNANKFSTV